MSRKSRIRKSERKITIAVENQDPVFMTIDSSNPIAIYVASMPGTDSKKITRQLLRMATEYLDKMSDNGRSRLLHEFNLYDTVTIDAVEESLTMSGLDLSQFV